MKDLEKAKKYQKKLYEALGREWNEAQFKKYWEGGIFGNEWDALYDQGLLENDFCAWCGSNELKSGYYRSPSFSARGVRVPICDDCFMEATDGNIQFKNTPSKSGCFIATAVLGDPFHPDIILLKNFRDNHLSKHPLGLLFIRAYYFLSPPIAKLILRSSSLRIFVKNKIIIKVVKLVRQKYGNT